MTKQSFLGLAALIFLLAAILICTTSMVQGEESYAVSDAAPTETATLTAQPSAEFGSGDEYQMSGVEVCYGCPTWSATWNGPTPTRLPDSTPTPIPTQTVVPTRTPTPTPRTCAWQAAAPTSGSYRFNGPAYQYQNIRRGPSTAFAVVGNLRPGISKEVYWSFNGNGYRWLALDRECRQWVAQLGR